MPYNNVWYINYCYIEWHFFYIIDILFEVMVKMFDSHSFLFRKQNEMGHILMYCKD